MTGGLAVVLVAALAAVVVARPAAAAPVQAPSEEVALQRPDQASALVTARMTGKRVLITGATSETSESWALPSGEVQVQTHAGPVRVRRDGGWVPVDLTLVPQPDGSVAPRAHPFNVRVSGARDHWTSAELVSLDAGGGRLALEWPQALPAPVLQGAKATYAEVLPGVDLVVEATRAGVETFLVVKSPEAVKWVAEVAMPVTGSGLASLVRDEVGNTEFRNAGGEVFATSPAPLMWDARVDASGEPAEQVVVDSDASAVSVRVSGWNGADLTLRPDMAWLTAPQRVYPVTIDPQLNPVYTSFDTYVKEGLTSDRSGDNDLQLGLTTEATPKRARSFVHWPTSTIRGKQITSATAYFWNWYSTTCSATSWEIWSTGPASTSTRWTNQPSWLYKEASSTQTKGLNSTCDDGWVSVSATSFFQRAARANQSTAYMGIRASETSGTGWKQFRSRNAASSSQVPYAVINYNSYPTVGTRSTVPSTTCTTGTGRPFINTTTPTLRSVISDAEGSSVKANVVWWAPSGTAPVGSYLSASAASGTTFSVKVPSGQLANGASYKWQVRGYDGTVYGSWSSWCEFTVDTTAPVAPTVSSTDYPEGGYGGGAGTAGSFTFNPAGSADVTSYLYGLDMNPPTQTVNAPSLGAAATVSITPASDGPHTLYVRSRDRAGNVSSVRSYAFNAGSAGAGAITSPSPGAVTASHVSVISDAPAVAATGVTYQWRRGDTDAWLTIPAVHVHYAEGGAAVTWPVAPIGGGQFPPLNWDVKATLSAADSLGAPRDGPVQVRGVYNTGVDPSNDVRFTFDRDQASATASQIGPGAVNLLTGNYAVGQSDVAVIADGGGLSVGRTFNTRRAGQIDPLFGPGWTSGLIGVNAGLAYTRLDVYGSVVEVGLPDGTVLGFAKQTDTGEGAIFEAQTDAGTLTLTYRSASDTYILTERAGGTVTFGRQAGDPPGQYVPVSATTAGAAKVITYSWEQVTVDGVTVVRPTRVLAPVPTGVSSCATLVRGCRALTFTYATVTTATGSAEAEWGDHTGRVSQISVTAWDPDLATPAMRTVVMARYAYDNTGRLRAAWDPRLDWTDAEVTPPVTRSLRTTYGYDSDGILTTLTPPGQQPWQFSYTTMPGDSGRGRLHRVSRSALSAGTATSTVVYGVPLTGVGAPYDLSAAQTARWGQTTAPVDATAVFPPDQIPTGDPATGTLPSSWERAAIAYLDANARIVNTSQPGGHLDATSYDTYGNVVAQISAGNRARALDASDSDDTAAEAELAASLSTLNVYTADGARLTDAFGPEHDIVLPDGSLVRGRAHTAYIYDQGAPSTGGPYDLITTETTTVRYRDAGGAQIDADARTTTTGYDWNLRLPTTVTVDPGGLNLVSTTVYDGDGRVLEHTQPGAEGAPNTPHTLRSVYYTAGANSTYPQCGDHPEWSGLLCRREPLGSSPPSAPLVVTQTTYDMHQQRRTVTEQTKDDVLLRTTTISYDSAGRVVEATITSPAGLGEPVPTLRQVYDPATGQLVRTQSVDSSGAVTEQIVRGYDALGRPIAYTDADGNTATTGYDLLSRPITVTDGKGTRSYTYDGGAEPRGLPTALVDSQAGTFTAQYDADGLPVAQTWPNGVTVTLTSDEAGNATTATYTQPGCGAEDCTLFTETVQTSVHGQRRAGASTLSEQTFGYDNAGRLTTVNDTVAGNCTTRVSTYSAATNRTGATSYDPGEGGACQSSTAHSSRTWTYDNADRLTTPGTGYDQLGRTTTVAASDTVGAATQVSNQYYTNDMVRQITQDTTTATYTLDVLPNRIRAIHTGTTTKTNHYSDDGDNPAWIDEDGWYTRVLPSLAGIAGIYTGVAGHIEWQITNLHGDFVATIIDGTPGLSATHETDEQGQRRDLSQAQRRYGWLGSAQRAADNPGDLITMGVRLYNPGTGRFLSNDPIYGGNANAYEYGHGDGVNNADPSGAISCTQYYYRKTYSWWRGTTIDRRFRCYIPNWLVRAYVWGWVAAGGLIAGVGPYIASKIPHWVSVIITVGSLAIAAVYIWFGNWLRSLYDDYCRTQGVYIKFRVVYNLRYRWAVGRPWGISCVSWR